MGYSPWGSLRVRQNCATDTDQAEPLQLQEGGVRAGYGLQGPPSRKLGHVGYDPTLWGQARELPPSLRTPHAGRPLGSPVGGLQEARGNTRTSWKDSK